LLPYPKSLARPSEGFPSDLVVKSLRVSPQFDDVAF
jgi:hypothetical protein